MKTEQILPSLGWFTTGLFAGIILFALIFLPQYQREVNKNHYAELIIEECIEQYDDFYDTIAEGDNYCEYISNK